MSNKRFTSFFDNDLESATQAYFDNKKNNHKSSLGEQSEEEILQSNLDVHTNTSERNFTFRKPDYVNQHRIYEEQLAENWWTRGVKLCYHPVELYHSIKNTFGIFQVAIVLALAGMACGGGLITYGAYLSLTKEVAAVGGEFWEGFVGQQLRHFNPALASNSQMEDRVTSLLYHPLYNVEHNDILNNISSPKLTPVLLDKNPEWIGTPGKSINFQLKKNLKWSSGKPITVEDVAYSFARLKEKDGNPRFNSLLKNLEFKTVGTYQFEINASDDNFLDLSLLSHLNFRPISKSFYQEKSNIGLITDLNSVYATVTSGDFGMSDSVIDPVTNSPNLLIQSEIKNEKKPNPIRNSKTGKYETIVLNRSGLNNNTSENVWIEKYIITNFDSIKDNKNLSQNSLEAFSKKIKLNLFTRTPDSFEGEIGDALPSLFSDYTQKYLPGNQVYSLFVNMARRNDGYLINGKLRKYLICSLSNFNPKESLKNKFTPLGSLRKNLPIQLGTSPLDCPTGPEDIDKIILSAKDDSGQNIYTINNDMTRNIKEVNVYGMPIRLNILNLTNSGDPMISELRQNLLNIGFATNEPISEAENISVNLENRVKNFNLALIDNKLEDTMLYNQIGAKSWDISQVGNNSKDPIPSYDFEKNLINWKSTNNQESKDKLISFYQNEYSLINLWQAKTEVSYFDNKSLTTLDLNSEWTSSSINKYLYKLHYNTDRK